MAAATCRTVSLGQDNLAQPVPQRDLSRPLPSASRPDALQDGPVLADGDGMLVLGNRRMDRESVVPEARFPWSRSVLPTAVAAVTRPGITQA